MSLYTELTRDRTTDKLTGEVLSETENLRHVGTKRVKAKEFFKLYLQDHQHLLNLKDKEYKYVGALNHIVNFNTNTYALFKDDKEKIAKMIGVQVQTISNLNGALLKKGIITKSARGKFILNPKYVFQGDEIKHEDVIITYSKYIIDEDAPSIEDEELTNSKLNA